jgi:hypothetical protein
MCPSMDVRTGVLTGEQEGRGRSDHTVCLSPLEILWLNPGPHIFPARASACSSLDKEQEYGSGGTGFVSGAGCLSGAATCMLCDLGRLLGLSEFL